MVCQNPECKKLFTPKRRSQKYHQVECRLRAERIRNKASYAEWSRNHYRQIIKETENREVNRYPENRRKAYRKGETQWNLS